MPSTTTWPLPPHSAAKHALLRSYLQAWFPKLAFTQARFGRGQLNYIDAFAGPGIYDGGEPGSPLVALETLLEHQSFPQWFNVDFNMLFVERDPERMESLKTNIQALFAKRPGGQPKNVHVECLNSDFLTLVNQLKGISVSKNADLTTTFAFVDPFGFSDIPLPSLCDLLSVSRCEVLFNFMYEATNRFITHGNEKIQDSFHMLFDGYEHLEVDGKTPAEREEHLNELVERILIERGKFEYVRSFKMEGMKERTLYTLFYATHHIEGLKVMKEAMWKVDPTNGKRFSDRLAVQPTLFEGQPNYGALRSQLLAHWEGRRATIEDLEEFALVSTNFKDTHLKKYVLKPLEKEGYIKVDHVPKRNKGTFPSGTSMEFLSVDK